MIDVWIDELTPCLKDNETGELVDTKVVRIRTKGFLSKYNKSNGWYVSWRTLINDHEIYALLVTETSEIQGLVALAKSDDLQAVHIAWMVTAPHNNKAFTDGNPKYSGVGGHLFAIASERSMDYGYNGVITGYAANMDLVNHYCSVFNAEHLAMLHPYQITIFEAAAAEIRSIYDYDWTGEEI